MPQKRKLESTSLAKHPCPCCGSLLTKKTIKRHASGAHVPTRITVTLAAHKQANPETSDSDASGGDSGDLSGDFNPADGPIPLDADTPADAPACIPVEEHDQSEAKAGGLPELVRNAWGGSRSRLYEYQSDMEEEDFYEKGSQAKPDEDGDTDTEGGSEFEWEERGIRKDLGIDDLVEEDLQRVISQFGAFIFHSLITAYNTFANMPCHLFLAEELSEEDMDMLRSFTLKVEERLSEETWSKMMHTFHHHKIPSLKITKARVEFLAAYRPVSYDCCVNSCICYVGPHEMETHCPYCQSPRKNNEGHSRKTFTYSPIIPRLKGFFKNPELVKLMHYRSTYTSQPDTIQDIFDGENYKRLKEEFVMVGGVRQGHKYFSNENDIALGLSLDGFCPFKRRSQTCWPLIIFNYNLPPDIRFHLCHLLCAGVIPGPQKPKDADSFVYPLILELLEFLMGIPTFDIQRDELFALRAFLIVVFGDIPAISMIMRMKGHNAIFPCRMCMIKGVRVPDTRNTSHYVPLYRANHPTVLADEHDLEIPIYNPANLPLRTHEQFLEQARNVQLAPTSAEEQRRAKACGIKGIPVLSHLSSLSFPSSFPFDFMHLVWENLIPNLVLLWTGKFKGLDEGDESYRFNPGVWEAIGEATKNSGSTVPAAYATARPHNIAEDASASTADSWSFWALYLGPVLLKGRFSKEAYYKHFVRLIKLLRICLQFEISKNELSEIREGLQDWVKTFERYITSGYNIFNITN